MGNHDDRLAFPVQGLEQLHDLPGRLAVKTSGRFIGQKDRRIIDNGPGDRDPFLLATGKLVRQAIRLVGQTDFGQDQSRHLILFFGLDPGNRHRQLDILQDRQIGDQLEGLEDYADVFTTEIGPLLTAQLVEVKGIDQHLSPGRMIEAPHYRKQGGFSGTGLAHDTDKFTLIDMKIHITNSMNDSLSAGIILTKIPDLNKMLYFFNHSCSHSNHLILFS